MSYVKRKGSFGKNKEGPPSYAPSRCRASFPAEVSGTKPSAVFDPDLVLNTADVVPKERWFSFYPRFITSKTPASPLFKTRTFSDLGFPTKQSPPLQGQGEVFKTNQRLESYGKYQSQLII